MKHVEFFENVNLIEACACIGFWFWHVFRDLRDYFFRQQCFLLVLLVKVVRIDYVQAVLVIVLRKVKLGQIEVCRCERQVVPKVGLVVELNGCLVSLHCLAVHSVRAVGLGKLVPRKHELEKHLVCDWVFTLVRSELNFDVNSLKCVLQHLGLLNQILCRLLDHLVNFQANNFLILKLLKASADLN